MICAPLPVLCAVLLVKPVPPIEVNGGVAGGLIILALGSAVDSVGTGIAGGRTTDSEFAGAVPMTAGGITAGGDAAGVAAAGAFPGGRVTAFSISGGVTVGAGAAADGGAASVGSTSAGVDWETPSVGTDSVGLPAPIPGGCISDGAGATLPCGTALLRAAVLVADKLEIGSRRNCVE